MKERNDKERVKVKLVDSKGEEIDVPVELEKVVAEYGAEAEANPGQNTTKMVQLMEEIGEIRGLELDKIKAVITYEEPELGGKVKGITLCFLD